jgi:hypothetical protein
MLSIKDATAWHLARVDFIYYKFKHRSKSYIPIRNIGSLLVECFGQVIDIL